MEKSEEKDLQDISISDGKITPSKDKDSSSETKSNPPTPKRAANLYLNQIQSNNLLMSEDNFIGISGLIGAGKTTLAKALGKVLNLPVYYEPIIENEYLEDFYRDMKRYSFSFQIYLLNCRFRQHQQVLWNEYEQLHEKKYSHYSLGLQTRRIFGKNQKESERM